MSDYTDIIDNARAFLASIDIGDETVVSLRAIVDQRVAAVREAGYSRDIQIAVATAEMCSVTARLPFVIKAQLHGALHGMTDDAMNLPSTLAGALMLVVLDES